MKIIIKFPKDINYYYPNVSKSLGLTFYLIIGYRIGGYIAKKKKLGKNMKNNYNRKANM